MSALALLAGAGVSLAVGHVLDHATTASAAATAQYLPPVGQEPEAAPDFTLTDQSGAAVSMSALRGSEVLVTFMDPRCTAMCPILAQEIQQVEARLPAATTPVLLIVSVAPGRSAADVSTFTSHVTWRPGWHWLLGGAADLQAVWAMYHVAVQPTATDVAHDETLYIVDPQGRITAGYNAPLPIDEVAASIAKYSPR